MNPGDKARELFLSYLSVEQCRSFQEHKVISCVGNITKEVYRLECGGGSVSHNIRDSRHISYCIVPWDSLVVSLPIFDTLLSQKLVIENDEELFLKTAFRALPAQTVVVGLERYGELIMARAPLRPGIGLPAAEVVEAEVAAPVEYPPRPDALALLIWAIFVY